MSDPLGLTTIWAQAEARPDDTAAEVASRILAGASTRAVRAFAHAYLVDEIESYRRETVRAIEAAAERPLPLVLADPLQPRFDAMCADPVRNWVVLNAVGRKKFRRWLGDGFDAWYASWHAAISARVANAELDEDDLEHFEANWYADGVKAYSGRQLTQQLNEVLARHTARIRLELTEELLHSVFALGDGVRVTWGDATVAQHRQRIALLVGQASGSIETAARHQRAVEMLRAADATTLRQLAAQAEAA